MYSPPVFLDSGRSSATVMKESSISSVRVEASTPIPAGTMMGPYPGHFLLGYILTDEKIHSHIIKVKFTAGKVAIDQGELERELVPGLPPSFLPTWLAYIAAARDRHEQTVEAIKDPRGFVFYRMLRDIRPGEELSVWYGDELARDCGISPLAPANIRGNKEYNCDRCPKTFQFPNTLKAHLRFHCPGQLSGPNLQHNYNQPQLAASHLESLKIPKLPTTRATGSAFTPFLKSPESPKDLSMPVKTDDIKEAKEQKRTPPSRPSDFPITSGLARTLFPEYGLSPPSQHPLLATSANPLIRYYQSLYPAGTSPIQPQLPMSTPGLHPHLLQAYRSLLPGMYPMHNRGSPPDVARMSPPNHSPGMTPPSHGHSMGMTGFFPMPSEKDGEPLDLLPKSLYMNKTRHGKGHLCIYCGKLYSRKYGLKIHLRTHTGYKPLKCKVCLRPFGDPSNLNKHIRLHAEGETPYRCDYCGKVLVRRRDLERHVKSRHPKEWSTFESKKVVNELQNKSVDIDANDNEVDVSDDTDNEDDLEGLEELAEEGCCDDEIEVD